MFLEGEYSPDFKSVQAQFLNKLPKETEEVVPLDAKVGNDFKNYYPPEFISELMLKREAFFQDGERQGAGKIFHIRNKDYLVLLTAVDQVGIRMMEHLITVIVVVMTICVLATVSISYAVSAWLLNPISSKIRKANSISANNLHERLDVIDPQDEMGQLAMAFNGLLDRVEHAFHTQKLFIDNASHEIRNPLTAIMGESEVALERPRETKEYVQSLKSISMEADRLNVLVNDLLQLAGINQKEVSFSREAMPVRELLVLAMEKLTNLHARENPRINLPQEDNLICETVVEGNRQLLVTAFFNLLDNASKFSGFKPVDVSARLVHSGHVEVSIADHGIGIPARDIKNITQPFHRASNVRTIRGTGIGIPLTLRIIELHGGTFKIDSTKKGTTARVTLPAKQDEF